MRRYFSQTLFFFLCSTALALTVEEAFEAGNQAYTRGENTLIEARNKGVDEKEPLLESAEKEFERALANFNSCLGQAESSALHFNMGNTYFKLGQLGRSIFHFRRSQELEPSSEESRANLRFVQNIAGLEIPASSLYEKTLARRSAGFWAFLFTIGFWVGAALLVFPRMFGSSGPVLPIVGIVVLLFSLIPAWAVLQSGRAKALAIILDNETPLLVSPTEGSATATFLQGGDSVQLNLKKTHSDHLFVATVRGEEGWVPKVALGRVRE